MLANLAEWGDRLRVPGKQRPRAKTASEAVGLKNASMPKPWDEMARHVFNNLKVAASGCWEWQLSKDTQGYGTVTIWRGKRVSIVVFVMFNGLYTRGMYVCHKCNNEACANPEHLYLATPSQNRRDALRDGLLRFSRGSQNANASLTETQVIEIRRRAAAGECPNHIRREYGVQVHNVVTGTTWRHVPMPPELIAKYGQPKPPVYEAPLPRITISASRSKLATAQRLGLP